MLANSAATAPPGRTSRTARPTRRAGRTPAARSEAPARRRPCMASRRESDSADHLRVAAEPIVPEPLADHGHRRVVGPFVVTRHGRPSATGICSTSKTVPDARTMTTCAGSPAPVRFVVRTRLGDRRERRRLAPPLFEVARVHRMAGVPPRDPRHDLANRHQTLRLAVGERPQHHAVDDENTAVDAPRVSASVAMTAPAYTGSRRTARSVSRTSSRVVAMAA